MTQDERWLKRYKEVIDFIETNHQNPSRHRLEEHDLLNWIKHNRQMMNKGKLKENRVELFGELVDLWEENKRKNQYQ